MVTRVLVVIASIAVIALIIGGVVVMHGGAAAPSPSASSSPKAAVAAATPGAGLVITDETVGTGATAEAGKTLSMSYTGTLADGTVFDSTAKDGGTPFSFTLGSGQVIKGWEQGIAGMKVGGKRKLVIPPDLAYGATANGSIPANSTLTFEVELLGVK